MTSGETAAIVIFSIVLTLTFPFWLMVIAVSVSHVFWWWIAFWRDCLLAIQNEWCKAKNRY